MDESPVTISQPSPRPLARRLINLSRYKVVTYSVSLVAEPLAPSRFEKHRRTPVQSAEDAYQFANLLFSQIPLDRDREHFILLGLNNKNRFEGFKVISTGSLTGSLVHPREAFHAAIVLHAAGVIFVHNHPSGNPKPSPEDIDITKRLKQTADIIGMRMLDHVIMGEDRYFSFNDRNML